MSDFLTSKKAKIYDILPDIKVTSNDESILHTNTDDDLNIEEKTKYVVVSDNIGLSLSDLKDLIDTKTQRRSDKNIKIKRKSERK